MMQKYGHMANEIADREFSCLVCGGNKGFNWSDLHGEGMCNECGIPYDLKVKPHKCNIREDWIPAIKTYWDETHAYIGLGSIFISRDYPECVRGQRAFNEWLEKHPDMVPAQKNEVESTDKTSTRSADK